MRFNIFAVVLLLSSVVIAAPVDLSARSDELLDSEDIFLARAPPAANFGDPMSPPVVEPRHPTHPHIRGSRHIGKRSDELEDEIFAREPTRHRGGRDPPYNGGNRPRAPTPNTMRPNTNIRSRIPRWVGRRGGGVPRPRAPTPNGRRN